MADHLSLFLRRGSIPATDIGPIMREAREAAGLTQKEVGRALGVSRWSMTRLEGGHGSFHMEWLVPVPKLPQPLIEPVVTAIQALYEAETVALDTLIPAPPASEPPAPKVRLFKRPTGIAPRPEAG